MIRQDLIDYISSNNLNIENFLEKPNLTDSTGYRAGIINNYVICYNPTTDLIMDYFYDDSEKKLFDIIKLLKLDIETNYTYLINRAGEIFSKHPDGTIVPRKIRVDKYRPYPFVILKGKDKKTGKKKCICLSIHRILAIIFIPNPSNKCVVDHIDRNKLNYDLCNLHWVSHGENNENKINTNPTKKYRYESYLDSSLTQLVKTYNIDDLTSSGYKARSVVESIRIGKSYYKFYWKIVDTDVENYLGGEKIDESSWILNYRGDFFVNSQGLIKYVSSNKITIGRIPGGSCYRSIGGSDKTYRVNVVVAETHLNNNKPIPNGLYVDHIDTDTLNNRVTNLRICTQSENMNNELTLKKLKKLC